MKLVRPLVILVGLLGLWQLFVTVTDVPHYLLPAPSRVLGAWAARASTIAWHAIYTMTEILLGLGEFKRNGLTEIAIRIYEEPEKSIRLIGETIAPALKD